MGITVRELKDFVLMVGDNDAVQGGEHGIFIFVVLDFIGYFF